MRTTRNPKQEKLRNFRRRRAHHDRWGWWNYDKHGNTQRRRAGVKAIRAGLTLVGDQGIEWDEWVESGWGDDPFEYDLLDDLVAYWADDFDRAEFDFDPYEFGYDDDYEFDYSE